MTLHCNKFPTLSGPRAALIFILQNAAAAALFEFSSVLSAADAAPFRVLISVHTRGVSTKVLPSHTNTHKHTHTQTSTYTHIYIHLYASETSFVPRAKATQMAIVVVISIYLHHLFI